MYCCQGLLCRAALMLRFSALGSKAKAGMAILLVLAACYNVRPVSAFTCPSTCVCGASGNCLAQRYIEGMVLETCASCTKASTVALPVISSDTTAL